MNRLNWTPSLVERFWRARYELGLVAADFNQRCTRQVAATLRIHVKENVRVVELGNRDTGMASYLLHAGFEYGYVDAGALMSAPCGEVIAHPRWRGSFIAPAAADADLVLGVEILGHLLEYEIDGWFAAARLALRRGGTLALTVRNSEQLDQQLAICPKTGVVFHANQRMRSFTPESLEKLLDEQGFTVTVLQQVEVSEQGFAKLLDIEKTLSDDRRAHIGNADTLFVLAVRTDQPFPADVMQASRWLGKRRDAAADRRALSSPKWWNWTHENVERFWTWVDGSPLDDLSFGRQSGPLLLSAVEPWLVPDGRHLDIGAGDGSMAELMLSSGYPVATLEPSKGRRARLDQRLERYAAYLGAIHAMDETAPFDVVLATEVIEHVLEEDLPEFLRLIREALQAGGTLILSTPNRENLRDSLIYCPESEAVFHRWQHVHSFDKDSLGKLLADHGFVCETMHEVDFGAISNRQSPYFELVLGQPEAATVGNGATLLCIAHVASDAVSPVRPPRSALLLDRRIPVRNFYTAFGAEPAPISPRAEQTVEPAAEPVETPLKQRLVPTGSVAGTASVVDPAPVETVAASRPPLAVWILAAGYRAILPIARRVLPQRLKARMVPMARSAEQVMAAHTQPSFERRPVTLAQCPPALSSVAYAGGPILLVNNALAWGGVERQVVNTLCGLARRTEVPVGLLCIRLGYGEDYDFYKPALEGYRGLVRNVIEIRKARAVLAEAMPPAALKAIEDAIAWLPTDVAEDILRFAGDFAELKPSVVHAWQDAISIAAGYAAHLMGVPRIILSSRNVAPTNFAYYRPYMRNAYQELISCPAITMVNNSEAGAADYARWLGCPVERFVVKRNGIDTEKIRRADTPSVTALREDLGIPEGVSVVGSIFRFYDEKRPRLWVEAAALVAAQRPDVHFVIFGIGPLKAEIESIARRAGFETRFHCPGTIADPARGLSLLDVFVLTSQFEGTPNVVIEASLLGVPVVAVDAGGTAETILDGRSGFLVKQPEANAIAERILTILGDRDWSSQAKREGPAFIKHRFDLETMLENTLLLYRQQG